MRWSPGPFSPAAPPAPCPFRIMAPEAPRKSWQLPRHTAPSPRPRRLRVLTRVSPARRSQLRAPPGAPPLAGPHPSAQLERPMACVAGGPAFASDFSTGEWSRLVPRVCLRLSPSLKAFLGAGFFKSTAMLALRGRHLSGACGSHWDTEAIERCLIRLAQTGGLDPLCAAYPIQKKVSIK